MVERYRPQTTKGGYGRGFERMKERLGPVRTEELRQQVLKEQAEARVKWGGGPLETRDRSSYVDYPPPSGPTKLEVHLTLTTKSGEMGRTTIKKFKSEVKAMAYFEACLKRKDLWGTTLFRNGQEVAQSGPP